MSRLARGPRRRRTAGLTLMEVMVAVTLLSLLVVGMAMAMRIGLNAFSKTDSKLMDNRRVAGAQRLLNQELAGMLPLVLPCGSGAASQPFAVFQGEPQVMRLVSTFSLREGWRGRPQILELFVIPGEEGRGVRLVVNEIPYWPSVMSGMCAGFSGGLTRFPPPRATANSFVLADKLAYCRFGYMQHPVVDPLSAPIWQASLAYQGWPQAVRIDMAPLEVDPSRLQPISETVPLRVYRGAEIPYGDY